MVKPFDSGSVAIHSAPITTNTPRHSISSTTATRSTMTVSSMPRMFTNVLMATNRMPQMSAGTSGTMPLMACAATTYSSVGTSR